MGPDDFFCLWLLVFYALVIYFPLLCNDYSCSLVHSYFSYLICKISLYILAIYLKSTLNSFFNLNKILTFYGHRKAFNFFVFLII